MTISLCMIFKDEELYIKDAVLSVLDLVDECILVDSGSTDKSGEVLRQLATENNKIKLFSRSWPNDFSNQKNYAIECASSDWILFLDADERIEAGDHGRIKAAVAKKQIDAYLLPIKNYTRHFQQMGFQWSQESHWGPGFYLTYLHRLFRRNPLIRYEGIIHEQIEPSLDRLRAKTESLDAAIHHLGPIKEQDLGLQSQRYAFYEKLAREKIATDPNNGQAHWELGVILQKKNSPQEALKEFRTARDLNSNEEIFELYYFMTLFHLRDWKTLITTMPRFQKSKFFICVAEAQNDASKIEGLDEFQTDFVQVPLIAFELALTHGRRDLIEKYKNSSLAEFGKSGWPQLLEGAFLRQAGDFDRALPLLQEAYSKKCPRSFLELGITLAKLEKFKEARNLFDDESKLRSFSADEQKVFDYINAQIS